MLMPVVKTQRRAPRALARTALLAVPAVAVVMLAAGAVAPQAALLVVRAGDATAVLDADTAEVTATAAAATVSGDGAVLVSGRQQGPRTVLTATDAATATPRWSRRVRGSHDVRLVSADGDTVVLLRSDEGGSAYWPQPRKRTHLTVSRSAGAERHVLDGNFEPEALSRDGRTLFVISYLPPMAPERYQVRQLDLRTGVVGAVFTPDAELQEAMRGTARTQARSPDGRRLYTLYTVLDGDHEHAFVHVLDLDGLWAHCIDLPAGVATSEAATALAVSPDSRRLYVADVAGGVVAEIDTDRLSVDHSADITPAGDVVRPVAAAVDAHGAVVVAHGNHVQVRDPGGPGAALEWHVPGVIAGLQPLRAGQLAVALRDRRVLVVDPADGTVLRTLRAPLDDEVDALGVSTMRAPESIPCAC